jgi:integrase
MSRVNLTASRVDDFTCPPGKSQAFLWDSRAPGLALRVTANGARSFVFQSRLADGKEIRMTIGDRASWALPAAQAEARRLQGLIDQGQDPRLAKAATVAKDSAVRAAAKVERQRRELLALDAWAAYLQDRRSAWGDRNYRDHEGMTAAGGKERKGGGVTQSGPLRALLNRPLADLDAAAVDAWVTRETRTRAARAALGFRLVRAFVNWCAEHPDYRSIVDPDACKSRKTREKLGKPAAKNDSLQREQLSAWFREVRRSNPVHAAYLQTLLLTGARREEVLELRWEDVDTRWQSLRIKDKVEGERTIPLTPYVAQLLSFLPKGRGWVFSSPTAASGRLQEPRLAHNRALARAELPNVTLHGLRRSFGTLAEWVECPVGVVAQIMGHTPSAIAEKHYRVRPLDLLRMWHERIEAWILTEAGIPVPKVEPKAKPLQLVTSKAASV